MSLSVCDTQRAPEVLGAPVWVCLLLVCVCVCVDVNIHVCINAVCPHLCAYVKI